MAWVDWILGWGLDVPVALQGLPGTPGVGPGIVLVHCCHQ